MEQRRLRPGKGEYREPVWSCAASPTATGDLPLEFARRPHLHRRRSVAETARECRRRRSRGPPRIRERELCRRRPRAPPWIRSRECRRRRHHRGSAHDLASSSSASSAPTPPPPMSASTAVRSAGRQQRAPPSSRIRSRELPASLSASVVVVGGVGNGRTGGEILGGWRENG
ncbi:Os02g0589500 [Oryza sativa Japonica Group]|jgi:hypothetical protein|uniref:Os02g0589500 protein n=1 Tax=Oryza sativa subsp. japonica TaxID=39947 RepID=A0A0P0VL17_ORYSJ|nr:hypothetical protein EE612_012112 [Oryza sativa]BAS79493.1 Os02g0589500 [Oryza sativa Japonica Group]